MAEHTHTPLEAPDHASRSRRLRTLGVRTLTSLPETGIEHAGVVIWDTTSAPESARDSIVIAPGIGTANDVAQLLPVLAAHGAHGLVVKLSEAIPRSILSQADIDGVSVYSVSMETEWLPVITALDFPRHDAPVEFSGATLPRGDVFALADAIASSVGGATAIEDLHRQVVAYSTIPEQPIDEDRRTGILGRQVPTVDENDEQYALLFADPRPHRLAARPGALNRVAVAIMAGPEPLGSIWVIDAETSIDNAALRALARSAKLAALRLLELRAHSEPSRPYTSALVREVLEGRDDASIVLRDLGFPSGAHLMVSALRFADTQAVNPPRIARFFDFIANYVFSRDECTAIALIQDVVYIVAEVPNGCRESSQLTHLVERTERWLHLRVHAASGRIVTSASQLPRSRRDADELLSLVPTLGQLVLDAEQMRSYPTLRALSAQTPLSHEIRSREVGALHDHDRNNGTEYATTVLTFLENHQDVVRTAKSLFVHPNTLRYRLERIREGFGVDFTHPDDTLLLWLGLRLERFEREK